MDGLIGRGPDPGVGHDDVQPTEPVVRLAEQVLDLVLLGQVGGDDQALPGQLALQLAQVPQVAVAVKDELGPFPIERACRGTTDPAGGPGDEDDPVLESRVHAR